MLVRDTGGSIRYYAQVAQCTRHKLENEGVYGTCAKRGPMMNDTTQMVLDREVQGHFTWSALSSAFGFGPGHLVVHAPDAPRDLSAAVL